MTMTITLEEQDLRCAENIEVARQMNEAKRNDDFDAFRDLCITAGLSATVCFRTAIGGPEEHADEPTFYWERICTDRTGNIEGAKSNRDLARAMGIEVRNDNTAAASLLYRLTEASFSDIFDVDLVHQPHTNAQRGNGARVTMYRASNGVGRSSWSSHVFLLYQGKSVNEIIHRHVIEKSKPLVEAIGPAGNSLGQMCYEQRMLIPDKTMAGMLARVLRRGQEGHRIHVLGAFCPDYSYEPTGDPNLPWRYTFDNVGEGVGLVAQQFARVTAPLSQFLSSIGVGHEMVFGIGDFEADSAKILQRVLKAEGPDAYREFVRRCAKSLDAFRAKMGNDLPLTLELCDADRCKGRLRPYAREAYDRMVAGDFGRIGEVFGDPHKVIRQIVKENGSFYKRWYERPDMSEEEIRLLVLEQGAEYAALARIYAEDFGEENIIVLSGDRPLMHTFDAMNVITPILCVKRAY